jgi:acyl carrier protein phosphodiesterase
MISDFVKGRKKFDYPPRIQQGITLHRIIDTYTDDHAATREAKEFFRPDYRLYSGAFIDVVYDHFLANDSDEFSEDRLLHFSKQVYSVLDDYVNWLPPGFAAMLPYMKQQNWLLNYRTIKGTERSMEGVVRRARYLSESTTAAYIFEQHYQPLQSCYRQFWAEARPFIHNQFILLYGDGK